MKDSPSPKRPVGRLSLFTEELADSICERIANGESLRQIGGTNGMPIESTIHRWIIQDPDFASKYARARERQGDLMDEEQMVLKHKLESGEVDPAAGRVILGILQWRAAKLAPKKYGDKLDIQHSGNVEVTDASLDARISALSTTFASALGQAATGRIAEPD